jgi:hypothetical protein
MAIQNTAQWWIRTDGDDTNGGGYDSGISGAGTNYSDQALPQLSRTDFATSGVGSTTLTSGGGFTSDMIGNSIRLSAGTNLTLGDYFITAYTSSTEVTLDRAPDNGGGGVSGATGKLGGAWRQLELTCTNVATPCPNPTVAGNVINMRGDGSMNPTTQHYSFSHYRTFTGGTAGNQMVLRGYNGLPNIGTPTGSWLWHYQGTSRWDYEYIKVTANGSGNGGFGLFPATSGTAYRCIFNANGYNGIGSKANAIECLFDYTAPGPISYGAFQNHTFGYSCENCVFLGHNGGSTGAAHIGNMAHVHGCLFIGCDTGIHLTGGSGGYAEGSSRNTIVGSSVAGVQVHGDLIGAGRVLYSNLIANSAVGIKLGSSSTPLRSGATRNAFYNNTLNYDGIPAGRDDIYLSVDPFVDAANGNYEIKSGSSIQSLDMYANVPGYSNDTSNFQSIGAVQTNLPDIDTRFEDVQDGDSFYPFRHLVADDFYEDPPAEGTSDDFKRDYAECPNPFYRFDIGSGEGRDYASLTDFHAAYSNTLIDQPKSVVKVVVHNDTNNNEWVVDKTLSWTNTASNVDHLIITVDDDDWHKGREGYGVVIRPDAATSGVVSLGPACILTFERFMIDCDNQLTNNSTALSITNAQPLILSVGGTAIHGTRLKDLMVRGGDGTYNTTARAINGIYTESRPVLAVNCVVYNLLSSGASTGLQTIGISRDDDMWCQNCAVFNLDFTNSTNSVPCLGYSGMTDVNYGGLYDCMAFDINGTCVNTGVNVSSCVTDDSSGTHQSSASVEFVDPVNGDFRLRSGAVGAGIGPTTNAISSDISGKIRSNIVPRDAGPFNNIAGYDQEVRFPTEEETVEEASTYVDGEGTRLHPFRQFAEGRIFGTNPTHPLRSS